MHSITQDLKREHQQIRHILSLVGDQFGAEQVDYDLLVAGSGFIANDFETFHGAKEEIILDSLRKKWFIGDMVDEIINAHRHIKHVANQFYGLVHKAERHHRLTDDFEHAFALTRDAVQRNFAYEEHNFFPLAEEKLSREEWVEVRHAFGNLSDPLYGDKQARRHDLLYEKIVSLTNLRSDM